jgi:predicted nucleic acid-binding protein
MGGVYFADTFYWIALHLPQDQWHSRVTAWAIANKTARIVTTEEVLSEFLTWFSGSGPVGRSEAAESVRDILRETLVQVLPQTSSGFLDALSLYESRLDKEYSLTDCRSMLAMKSLGISDALSNDRHFAQEGFTVLFP